MQMPTNSYEVMFVVSGKKDTTHARSIVDKLVKSVNPESLEIKVLDTNTFAYPIKHETNGYFFVATFQSTAERINELNRLLRINSDVLRYLVINLDKNYGARANKNEKKTKLAQNRATKYKEVQAQAELEAANGESATSEQQQRPYSQQRGTKFHRNVKRHSHSVYRKTGVYFKNEEGEVTFEPVIHTAKSNWKNHQNASSEVSEKTGDVTNDYVDSESNKSIGGTGDRVLARETKIARETSEVATGEYHKSRRNAGATEHSRSNRSHHETSTERKHKTVAVKDSTEGNVENKSHAKSRVSHDAKSDNGEGVKKSHVSSTKTKEHAEKSEATSSLKKPTDASDKE